MAPHIDKKNANHSWPKANSSGEDDTPGPPSRLRTILTRAALVYLGLFLGVSFLMSVLGINPLIHNGALPKCLLVFVGLAVMFALANGRTNLVDEQVHSWLILFSRRPFRDHSDKYRH